MTFGKSFYLYALTALLALLLGTVLESSNLMNPWQILESMLALHEKSLLLKNTHDMHA